MSRIVFIENDKVQIIEFPSLEQALGYIGYLPIGIDLVVFDADGNIVEVL